MHDLAPKLLPRPPAPLAPAIAIAVLALAAVILCGWLAGLDLPPSVHAALLPIKANAALSLALLAAALWRAARPASFGTPRMARWLALAAACIAALTLCEYLLGWNPGFDRWLAADAHATLWPGRMSPLTATLFMLLAGAIAGVHAGQRLLRTSAQCMCLATIAASAVTLLAYLYHTPTLLHLGDAVPMARTTSVALMLLAIGTLTLRRDEGVLAPLLGATAAAGMGRRLIFAACVVLPILAWLRLRGQAMQLYDTEFGVALVVATSLAMLCALIVHTTSAAAEAETRIGYLNRTYSVLSEVNSLIVRTASQDELFSEASRIAVERGGFPRAWFGLVDAERRAITLVAGFDAAQAPSGRLAERLALDTDAMPPGAIARAVREDRPVVANDLVADTEDPFRAELLAHGIRSYAVFPLRAAGRVVGMFKLHAEVPHFFHAEELRLLAELAGDIGFAINHLEQRRVLDHLAFFDSLTGLANARLLDERLQLAIDNTVRQRDGLAVLVFDVAAFKAINEAYGRQAGDAALRTLAERLAAARGDAACARLGSNLFAVILTGAATEPELVADYERTMRACFADTYAADGHAFALSARAGIAILHKDGATAKALLNAAESALDATRLAGQRYRFAHPNSNARNAERIELHARLSRALAADEFALHYQPKVDCRTRRPVGAEALLRWTCPDLGSVPPIKFVPILEEVGLIDEVGMWALRQACADSALRIRPLHAGLRIAVNVSAAQLLQPDFVERVEAALGPHAAFADIDLELTESMIMADVETSIAKLRRLRALGMKIALDDFGTGYSSMAYLARLPLDYLKIDRAFVTGLPGDAESATIVASIIGLGHALGLRIIAEGIEDAAQADMLAELGCDELQGYHFGRPAPLAALLEQLAPQSAAA